MLGFVHTQAVNLLARMTIDTRRLCYLVSSVGSELGDGITRLRTSPTMMLTSNDVGPIH